MSFADSRIAMLMLQQEQAAQLQGRNSQKSASYWNIYINLR